LKLLGGFECVWRRVAWIGMAVIGPGYCNINANECTKRKFCKAMEYCREVFDFLVNGGFSGIAHSFEA
jgi:hypothetical protein